MVLFIALIYAPARLSASQAVDAPVNDLILLKRLLQYRKTDSQIDEAALPEIRRHLWYLRPPPVVFAPFSDSVEDAGKQEMAEKPATLPVPEAFLHDNGGRENAPAQSDR